MSDIDTAAADSLKVLDPKRPIREADIGLAAADVRFRAALGCPLSAISGPSALQQKKLFDHVIGLSQKRGWHSAGKTISRSSAKKTL